ncbi:MAG: sulfur carrier protein ThiS [Sulfurimonas sp.]|nr:sulfur carrier protein ThiS [Sulfurimonas sp.]
MNVISINNATILIIKNNGNYCVTNSCCKINEKEKKMKIIINGNEREFKEDATLQEVLKELSLEGKVMAAALNMEIVKQAEWKSCVLKDLDKLELLDFVGGG